MHETYMRLALEEARAAGAQGEVPVGGVIVREGKVIARATTAGSRPKTP